MGCKSIAKEKNYENGAIKLKTKEYIGENNDSRWVICDESGNDLTQLFSGEPGKIIQRNGRDSLGKHCMSLIFAGRIGNETTLYRLSLKKGQYEEPKIDEIILGNNCNNVEISEIRNESRSSSSDGIKVAYNTNDGVNNIIVSNDFKIKTAITAKGSVVEKKENGEVKSEDLSPFVIDSISETEEKDIVVLTGRINASQKQCLFSTRRVKRISDYVDSIGDAIEFERNEKANELYPHTITYTIPNTGRIFKGEMLIDGTIGQYFVDQTTGEIVTVPLIKSDIQTIDADALLKSVSVSSEKLKRQEANAMKLSCVSFGKNEFVQKEIGGVKLQYEIERTIDREICGIALNTEFVRVFKVSEGIHIEDFIKPKTNQVLITEKSPSSLVANIKGSGITVKITCNASSSFDEVYKVAFSSSSKDSIPYDRLDEVLENAAILDSTAIHETINLGLLQPKKEKKKEQKEEPTPRIKEKVPTGEIKFQYTDGRKETRPVFH